MWKTRGPWDYPTLGDRVIEFLEAHLSVPAGPLYGQPMKLTQDQVQFFCHLYELDDQGRFVYRRASRRGPKGKGKSPEGAMFCIAEFAGPVQFDGWNAEGQPVGRPRDYPWVQIAACSEEQDHNLYGPMREMLAESGLNADNGGYIDLGKTRVEFKDGRPGKIEPVSASSGAREGQPITAAALEETHLWFPAKGGDKLAAVLRRNVGKTNGRTCEFTNAPALGEGSVAEATLDAANRGQVGLLYDSSDGAPVVDPKDPENRDEVLASMRLAYDDGDGSPVSWVDLARQYEETQDQDVTEADVFRFYLNIARKAENRAFDPKQFDALAEPADTTREWTGLGYVGADIGPSGIGEDEPCLLVFDGARTRDCAVFTAWTLGETPKHHHVASWSRPFNATAGYQHPRGEYKAVAREFVSSHRVVLFAYDSSFHELDSMYDDWLDEFGEFGDGGLLSDFPTASGQRMQKALLQILEDTREGLYRHDGHPLVAEHVHNAVGAKNRGGWLMLAKEKDSMKIDAAVTMTFGYDLIPLARAAVDAGVHPGVFVDVV